MRLLLASILLVVTLAGCQTATFDQPSDTLGYRTREGAPPSLVFSPPEAADSDAPWLWYAGRRDVQPYTASGYRTATVESTVTFTRDHQSQHGGRVYDNYHSTTYSTQQSQTVR